MRMHKRPSLLVLIEALAILLPIPLRINHALEQDARPVLGVARALIECLLDRKTCVETNAEKTSAPVRKRAGVAYKSAVGISVYG